MRRRRRLAGLCLLAAVLCGAGCGASPEPEKAGGDPLAASPAGDSAPPALPPAATDTRPRFVDVTATSGVAWTHDNGAFGERWLPETMGPGVLLFDADGDDRLDLLFVNGRNFPGRPGKASLPALYLNRGGLRFEEATRQAGLDFSAYCLGGAAADVDNDGDADLYLTCLGPDRLLRNDSGRFIDVSREAGLVMADELGASAAFFDADRDGWLDLYATRYVVWSPETDIFCSTYGTAKSYCTASLYPGVPARFYRNRGDGTLEERTREAGLYEPTAKALGVVPMDVDGDGWIDLGVACDTAANLLYRNRGDGTFEEVGLAAGVALSTSGTARGGMGIDAGDFDRSGRSHLVVSYFINESVGLYENRGDWLFFDRAVASDVGRNTRGTLGWGTFFFDYDLDGWLDLLVANGHLDEQAEEAQRPEPYAQPQQLFHNTGGELVEVTDTVGGDLARPLVARGAAFGDLDDDGDLDLVLTTNGGPAHLFENRGGHGHWLRVDLEGRDSNRDGLGAVVTTTVQGASQSWLVRTGGSYLSQSQVEPTFGLGGAEVVDELVVRWPSGHVQHWSGVPADQRLEIVEEGR